MIRFTNTPNANNVSTTTTSASAQSGGPLAKAEPSLQQVNEAKPLISCLRSPSTNQYQASSSDQYKSHRVSFSPCSLMTIVPGQCEGRKSFNEKKLKFLLKKDVVKLNNTLEHWGIDSVVYEMDKKNIDKLLLDETGICARGMEKYLYGNSVKISKKRDIINGATLRAVCVGQAQFLPRGSSVIQANQREQHIASLVGEIDYIDYLETPND